MVPDAIEAVLDLELVAKVLVFKEMIKKDSKVIKVCTRTKQI